MKNRITAEINFLGWIGITFTALGLILFTTIFASAQNTFPSTGSAGIGTTSPNASSLFEVKSTTKGVLIPRMTKAQRDAIASPSQGLLVYVTDKSPGIYYYESGWKSLKGASKTLDNLSSPTAIDVDLLPKTTNSENIGSSSLSWKDIYASRLDIVSGGQNVFVGVNAGIANTNYYNTAVGYNALTANTSGSGNSAFGDVSLESNTTGYNNTAIGSTSLFYNTTGNFNSALGAYSLYNNTTGYGNVAIGTKASFLNTIGIHNTAVGDSAMYSSVSSTQGTAIGYKSLFSNINGFYNVALGTLSLQANTSGSGNTAAGNSSLYSNTTGGSNTAMGDVAMYYNTGGYNNTAAGEGSLYYNTTGFNDCAAGVNALYSNTTGVGNDAFGNFSLNANTTGGGNVAVGQFAMTTNITGSNNTSIGNNSGQNGPDYVNTTSVGNGATPLASNQVRIGNGSVTSIGGYVNWTNVSDGRIKKNIRGNVPGLDFISKLKPVTYNLDLEAADRIISKPATKDKDGNIVAPSQDDLDARAAKEKVLYSGFIAQDVEKAAKELGYDFSGVDAAKNDHDLYGLRYSDFVVPLVKAVQELDSVNGKLSEDLNAEKSKNGELNSEVGSMKSELKNQQKQIDELRAMISTSSSQSEKTSSEIQLSSASLDQNSPNPFSERTKILCYVPSSFREATLKISSLGGLELKSFSLTNSGMNEIEINGGTLSAGDYIYELIIDGNKIDSKKMTLTR